MLSMERRKTIIAGNWKMHKTVAEAVVFIEKLTPCVEDAQCLVWIAPPFTAIHSAAAAASDSKIAIGAQNMSDQDEGAFTGEISAKMLKEAGAGFVILGHSERRLHFLESDEHIHHKVRRALAEKLPVILCIGESAEERQAGSSFAALKKQLDGCLGGLKAEELAPVTIAYEPVWAIGTGKSATPEIAQETHAEIRSYLTETWGDSWASSASLLYGGSVKPATIAPLLDQPDIDGALIGGASLDVETFSQMVQR